MPFRIATKIQDSTSQWKPTGRLSNGAGRIHAKNIVAPRTHCKAIQTGKRPENHEKHLRSVAKGSGMNLIKMSLPRNGNNSI